MKKQFTTKMKVLTAVGVLSTMSLTAIAAPILQEVSATLRKDITFTLNGEKTLEGTDVLIYENSAYLPLRALGEELGVKVEYSNGEIKITNQANGMTKTVNAGETAAAELTPAMEGVHIPKAIIKAIDSDSRQITILPADKEDVAHNYIVLNLPEDMEMKDFAVDMAVSVTHSPVMTRSMPPQTAAFEIVPFSEVAPLENITLENVFIVEVGENRVVIGNPEDPKNIEFQTVLNIGPETSIRHYKNKKAYTFSDLKVGQKITVVHSPIMTLSLPGQTAAIEIILMD